MRHNDIRHKEVRDLAWAIKSPSMITSQDNWPAVVNANKSDWVDKWLVNLDNDPTPLLQHLAKRKSHFLGIYFESLWGFYLEKHPSFNLIAKNLQVNEQKRTVGEFDFIIQDRKSGAYIHQEIAIKFYLGFKQKNSHTFSDGKHSWLGPQCRDRLDLKMDKLINAQTNLSKTEAGQRTLHSLSIKQISSQIVIKGYLFYPNDNSAIAPAFCNPTHLRGSWAPLRTFIQQPHIIKPANAWSLLPKSDWLSRFQLNYKPLQKNVSCDFFTNQADLIETVKERIKKENRPSMIASLKQCTEGYIEVDRTLIVPDNWPNLSP